MNITYFLPVKGLSGGANSVIQEAMALAELGFNVRILVNDGNFRSLVTAYSELPFLSSMLISFKKDKDIVAAMKAADCFVLTLAAWVPHLVSLHRSIERGAKAKLFYYVQDYEALFYAEGSADWEKAKLSYDYADCVTYFAKTEWLCSMVRDRHGANVVKVEPSVDSAIFSPNILLQNQSKVRNVVAMLRPGTPRRAPRRTARVLSWMAENFDVSISVFGSATEDLVAQGYNLPDKITNVGRLKRHDVASLLRSADVVIDLSDYQAFGRTTLEAMACGAVAVVPMLGGSDEYIRSGINGIAVDTWSEEEVRGALTKLLDMGEQEFNAMRWEGIKTASEYSVRRAAVSIANMFLEGLA